MAPPFPSASLELDYPPYALDWDPEDANRLVVSGGGGTGRSGVGNKITVVDASAQDELRVAGELELPRGEDSVMSLAVGGRKGRTTYLYAGANMSPEGIVKGKNEQLRALGIEQSKARASTGTKGPGAKITELSRTTLFTEPNPDAYPRLLRVAGPMAAAASALGKEAQLAIFETAGSAPKQRAVLDLPSEAEDLDIIQTGENEFEVAFCYKYELRVVKVGKEVAPPVLVFTMPDDSYGRPMFRSIRYLSPDFILAAANLPNRSGVVLHGIRLPKGAEKARLATSVSLPGRISATALSACNLSPAASAGTPLGDAEFVIAVAAHDSSILLYTVRHMAARSLNLLSSLDPLHILKDVHGSENITGVAFSRFVPPKTHLRQQFLKLASISLAKSVTVHNIPLAKEVDQTPRNRKGPPRPVHYVVAMKSQGPSPRPVIIAVALIVLFLAFLGQVIYEMHGYTRPILHVHKILPVYHNNFDTPVEPAAGFLADEFMAKLAGARQPAAGETLVMWEGGGAPKTAGADSEGTKDIRIDVHDAQVHGPGMTWDELPIADKEAWKARLQDAGAWTVGMGETVFKGILFGELAGAVGQAVGG